MQKALGAVLLISTIFISHGAFSADNTENADETAAIAAIESASENLPVFKNQQTEKKEVKKPQRSLTTKVALSLAIVLAFLGISYLAFRRFFPAKKNFLKRKHIEVISQHYLGPKKSLALVKVAGETLLIGVTDNSVNLVKALSLLDGEIATTEEKLTPQFKASLKEAVKKNIDDENTKEEFSMQGLKELVAKRLESMREL